MEGLDVGRRLPQRLEEIGIHPGKGRVDLFLRDLQLLDLCAVEFQRVVLQGGVAPGTDVGKDAVHHIFHVLLGADIPVQDLFGLEFRKVIQLDHLASSCCSNAPRSFLSISSISRCLNW